MSRRQIVARRDGRLRPTHREVVSACARKVAFATSDAAQEVADRENAKARLALKRYLAGRRGPNPTRRRQFYELVVYRCPFLEHWHIGHDPRVRLSPDGPLPGAAQNEEQVRGGLEEQRQRSLLGNRLARARFKLVHACQRKRSFETWEAAEAVAIARMQRMVVLARLDREIGSLFVYRCYGCDRWHYRRQKARRRPTLRDVSNLLGLNP